MNDSALASTACATLGVAALCLALAWKTAPPEPADGLWLEAHAQEADEAAADGRAPAYQRLRQTDRLFLAEYGFKNFNSDPLTVDYQVPRQALAAYEAGFGYRQRDLQALASGPGSGQRIAAYLQSRGFKVIGPHTATVDIPMLVRNNKPLVHPVASAIDQVAARRRYDSADLLGAVTSMVQTAIVYRALPDLQGDLHVGAMIPPVSSLARGWGNCASKTGLLASVLANWPNMRMVGVSVPDHYLLGVLRIPGKDDLFVEHDGLQYVLVEPAGPAWLPPGTVAETTSTLLSAAEGYRVEPFF